MTYPDGRVLDYAYGSAGSPTDRLSRVVSIDDGATSLVEYEHTGSGQVITKTYSEPGIAKSLALGSGSNPYSALDRFGRLIEQKWTKGSSNLVHFEYDYDRVSNRLNERNKVTKSGSSNPAVDSLFGYDELNRMTSFKTGQLNVAGDAITSPVSTQTFTLDETGNMSGLALAAGATTTLTQTRSHNDVNEITAISETIGDAWTTPAHDAAGNMTSLPQPNDLTDSYDAVWDAWHRLVSLSDSGSVVLEFEYDGNNRRIIVTDSVETRHVYYNGQQAIEERVGTSSNADQQFVWNLGYVDDLVLRDYDTNGNGTLDQRLYALTDLRFSVMALANTSGSIVERFQYDAHGVCTVMDSNFVVRSSTNYDWSFRYTGRREDLTTGLYYFRARYYSAELGRFLGRDPIGYADGYNLYRGYFVPGGMDPSGNLYWFLAGANPLVATAVLP